MSKSKKKSNSPSSDVHNQDQAEDSLLGLFARFFWSLLGNLILFVLLAEIFRSQKTLTYLDLAYWVTVFLVVTVRYLDIKYLKGVTYEGLPATMSHWKKYVKFYVLVLAALWLLAHGVSLLRK
ncbi:MAG: hypothetical protein LLF76_07205 [Planctomycetaceae bacterium]|nr:hypothetical protein [Planctomycetaceae bacterium]